MSLSENSVPNPMVCHDSRTTSWLCFSGQSPIRHPYGYGSKPCTPDEHQNSWQMDVHPPLNGIYMYFLEVLIHSHMN